MVVIAENLSMALGTTSIQPRFENPREILGDRLREGSIYRLLADEGDRLFPDDYFADLYTRSVRGRPTVPARVLATVMVLQAFEGLSDREAIDHLEVDLRWQAACGVDTGAAAFHATVLVGQRNRLRASKRPRRIFEDTKVVAQASGAIRNRARIFDSTPIYDAVATQDTVTQLRAVIRKLLLALDGAGERELASSVRASLTRDDDYQGPGKPPCDWDDSSAREQLVDELVRDCHAALGALEGATLECALKDAGELLALVAGQDVDEREDGVFRIARKVAPLHPQEALLQRARLEQADPVWWERYRADRPMVERKIAHLVSRAWKGRRARTRGLKRVGTDLDTRAGAINLTRLAILDLRSQ